MADRRRVTGSELMPNSPASRPSRRSPATSGFRGRTRARQPWRLQCSARSIGLLPQLDGNLFLTDGGIETTLIFHDGFDLPYFAAFRLLRDPEGRDALVPTQWRRD